MDLHKRDYDILTLWFQRKTRVESLNYFFTDAFTSLQEHFNVAVPVFDLWWQLLTQVLAPMFDHFVFVHVELGQHPRYVLASTCQGQFLLPSCLHRNDDRLAPSFHLKFIQGVQVKLGVTCVQDETVSFLRGDCFVLDLDRDDLGGAGVM